MADVPQGFKPSKEISPEQNCSEQLGSDLVFPEPVSTDTRPQQELPLGLQHLLRSSLE